MQIKVTKVRDTMTPSLRAKLALLRDPKPALAAMGEVVVSVTMRAFTDASLRPSQWAPLAASTIKRRRADGRGTSPLLRTGLLSRSARVSSLSKSTVVVSSDRPYAPHQQYGTRRGVPARPFFPFDSSGRPTARVRSLMMTAADRALGLRS